ncbi:hypothetical protein RUND412_007178, partial [Rhizina undulata]
MSAPSDFFLPLPAVTAQDTALHAVQASIASLCASTPSALPSPAPTPTNLTLVLKTISKINTTSCAIRKKVSANNKTFAAM